MGDLIPNLIMGTLQWNDSLWGWLIDVFTNSVGSFALAIVLLTVLLKIILCPLEFLQRKSAKKQAEMTKRLNPEIEKIKIKYANKPEVARQKIQEKQTEFYKQNSMVSSCVIMLLNMVAISVVFLTLLSCLNAISSIQTTNLYTELNATYETTYTKAIDEGKAEQDATVLAQGAVMQAYKDSDNIQGFLWIKNVWQPDTAKEAIPNYKDFIKTSRYSSNSESENYVSEEEYNKVMGPIMEMEKGWNGYYILVLLAGAITFLASIATSGGFRKLGKKKENNQEDIDASATKAESKFNKASPDDKANEMAGKAGGLIKYILPAVMILITLFSNAIFSMYIITNSFFTLCMTPLYNKLIKNSEEKDGGHFGGSKKDEIVVDYRIQKNTIIKD